MEKAIKAEVYVGINGDYCDECAFTGPSLGVAELQAAECRLFGIDLYYTHALSCQIERCEPCKNSEEVNNGK